MINSRYLEMMSNLTGSSPKLESYLLVDGTNTFMRSAAANPAMSDSGQAIGALSGFLLSVGFAIKTLKITDVIIVFDGKNTRDSRRKVFPEYKANRDIKTKKLIRNELISSIEEDTEALKWQMSKLIEYIKLLPVKIILADYFEADDIIAYIANNYLKDKRCYIMSSDRDFYQLINDDIKIWSPTKKRVFTKASIKEDFGVETFNFILYKTLLGDKGDNVPGVKGLGGKTLLKYFSFLQENLIYNMDDIFNYCDEQIRNNTKYTIYQKVLDFKKQLLINYQIMQLHDISMSSNTKIIIDNGIKQEPFRLNKFKLLTYILEDQISDTLKNPAIWINECWHTIDCMIAQKKPIK
jgi:DNA polymerase-1